MLTYDEISLSEEGVSYDIVFRVLKFIERKNRALKTRILYASNLNTRSLERYLGFLGRHGLIEQVSINGRMFYVLTSKGRGFLYKLETLRKSLDKGGGSNLLHLVKDNYLKERAKASVGNLNLRRIQVVLIEVNAPVEEAASELLVNYVHAKTNGNEILGFIPSGLYSRIREIINDVSQVKLYAYDEYEDRDVLGVKLTRLLNSLSTQYVVEI